MNELSRGGRRAKQQRGQLCSDKTGEFEAAAPATWRKVSYHSPAVWTRFLVCWNVIEQEADTFEAAIIRTWRMFEWTECGWMKRRTWIKTNLVESDWTWHCWNPFQYQVKPPRLHILQSEPLQHSQWRLKDARREDTKHKFRLGRINKPDRCTGIWSPPLAEYWTWKNTKTGKWLKKPDFLRWRWLFIYTF